MLLQVRQMFAEKCLDALVVAAPQGFPRLPAERPHIDGGGAARTRRRAGLDAANLGPGSERTPLRFTMHSVPGLLKKMSVWNDYCDGERSMIDAIVRM